MQTDLFIDNKLNDSEFVKAIIQACIDNKTLVKKQNGFIDLSEPLRSMRLYMLGQNSYGGRWQTIITKKNNWISVSGAKGAGDFKNIYEIFFEFKVSYSDNSKYGHFSFWQERSWQPLGGYYFKAIDRKNNYKHYNFFLSKDQIEEEAILQNAKATHGTKEIADKGEFIERTIRLRRNNKEMWDRWINNYLVDDIKKTIDSIKK